MDTQSTWFTPFTTRASAPWGQETRLGGQAHLSLVLYLDLSYPDLYALPVKKHLVFSMNFLVTIQLHCYRHSNVVERLQLQCDWSLEIPRLFMTRKFLENTSRSLAGRVRRPGHEPTPTALTAPSSLTGVVLENERKQLRMASISPTSFFNWWGGIRYHFEITRRLNSS